MVFEKAKHNERFGLVFGQNFKDVAFNNDDRMYLVK